MALFYIFGRIDTGRCSQTQRPLTHQSKRLLYSAAPHHTKVLSLQLSLHLLCALSPTSSFSELILLHKVQSSLASPPLSVQSFSDLPTSFLPSHSLFLLNALLPCLHSHPLPLYPLQTKILFFSPSIQQRAGSHSGVKLRTKQNTACCQAAVEDSSSSNCLCTHWSQVCLI